MPPLITEKIATQIANSNPTTPSTIPTVAKLDFSSDFLPKTPSTIAIILNGTPQHGNNDAHNN